MTHRPHPSPNPRRSLLAGLGPFWMRALLAVMAVAALLAPTAGLVHGVVHNRASAQSVAPSSVSLKSALAAPAVTVGAGHEAGSDECRLWDQLLGASPLRCAFGAPAVPPQPAQARREPQPAFYGARPYGPAQARGPPAAT